MCLYLSFTLKSLLFYLQILQNIFDLVKMLATQYIMLLNELQVISLHEIIHNDVLPEYAVQNSTFVWEWVHSLSTCKCSAWVVCGAFAGMGLRWWWSWLRYRVV